MSTKCNVYRMGQNKDTQRSVYMQKRKKIFQTSNKIELKRVDIVVGGSGNRRACVEDILAVHAHI